jgi:hypothetical protein
MRPRSRCVTDWRGLVPGVRRQLLDVACTRMLGGLSKLSREEMRLAAYPETASAIDVCEGSH